MKLSSIQLLFAGCTKLWSILVVRQSVHLSIHAAHVVAMARLRCRSCCGWYCRQIGYTTSRHESVAGIVEPNDSIVRRTTGSVPVFDRITSAYLANLSRPSRCIFSTQGSITDRLAFIVNLICSMRASCCVCHQLLQSPKSENWITRAKLLG